MNLETEIEKLHQKMAKPNFWQDKVKADKVVEKYNSLKKQLELSKNQPAHMQGEYDAKNAILTISSGTGGTEACDWAEMLLKMYLKYSSKMGWVAKITSISPGNEAGIKSATVEIEGSYIYGSIKNESGIHRLVRISPFDADKARHTSFALVEIIPQIEDKEMEVPETELRIDVFRASGHGGQSVNTTDSAVRITHLPSGIVSTCQNERSQYQNKLEAMKILKSRLFQAMKEQKAEKLSQIAYSHKGSQWGAQIRSYVLEPYKLVKDHRTGYKSKKVDEVLDGNLDEIIQQTKK